jgi:hypothetical protein
LVKLERRKNLTQAKLLAVKLAEEEKTLHQSFPPALKKVLEGKNLLVWKALLEKYGYDDLAVVRFMQEGVELAGMHDPPSCYPAMLKPATVTLEGLQASSTWRRRAVVGKMSKADPSHVELLEQTAVEELQMGLGKCLDLSKAYKQMAVHPDHRHLAVIFYHDLEGRPKYYGTNSLLFGSCAAVCSFNRVPRSLWFLLNKILAIPCGVFYDDFPMFQPEGLSEDANLAVSQLLDLWCWKHARTGTKAAPFQSKLNVLGCLLDLGLVVGGSVVLENKPGRIDRLVELLDQGQVIHGLKRYACGFFSVKFLHQICAEVSTLSGPLSTRAPSDVRSFCEYAVRILQAAKPRKLNCGFEMKPLLLFSDGCWENGFAGIGAVIVDTASRASFVCVGTAPKRLLELWKVQIGWYIICQSELYAMVLIRWQCQGLLWDRRSI